MHWYLTSRTDVRARLLADRHYSRKTPGHHEFCPPGHNIVLIIPALNGASAVWVSQRPAPASGIGRADGFEYWNNVIFRNEAGIKSSLLILEAIAITRYLWPDIPRDGMHSFVDPRKVRGIQVRGKVVHGFSLMKAGFELSPERTKSRNLLRWILSKQSIQHIRPLEPLSEQLRLFA